MRHEKIDAEGGVRTMHTQNQPTPRKRALLVMACVVAGLVILAGAASAGAAIKFIWKVEKAEMKENDSRKVKFINALGKVTFEDARFTVVCDGLEAEKPLIYKEKVGRHVEGLKFKECNVTSPAKGCKVKDEAITAKETWGDIVEGVGKSKGKVLLLFSAIPMNQPVLPITIEKVGAEACPPTAGMASKEFKYRGNFLAEGLNAEEELVAQKFKFDFAEPNNFSFTGGTGSAFLKEGCNIIKIKGEIIMELESSESFGPF